MRQTYERAFRTLVWLGPDVEGLAATAFDTIERLGTQLIQNSGFAKHELQSIDSPYGFVLDQIQKNGVSLTCSSQEWEAIYRLFTWPWFSRLWVIQELNSSSTANTICGRCVQDSRLIALCALWISSDYAWFNKQLQRTSVNCASDMILPIFQTTSITKLPLKLYQASGFSATDPRDRVFAMIDSKLTSQYCLLEPDYSRSTADIFRVVAETCILESKGLRVLSFV
jgi:Heterokaryon incompatibility protein (HET)